MDILSLTAVELAKAIREGKTTSVEATQAVLDKIAASEDTYHCYVTVEREKALQQAAEVQKKIEAGELTGPLAGVPFAIKDNMCTEGTLTTCSSKILENFVPTFSAEAVLNLEKAGAVILGKTNMDEFAMGSTTETSYYGVTKNPRNPEHVPGGSSGGTGASIACNIGIIGLGTDTINSVRSPSSANSLVGIRPTSPLFHFLAHIQEEVHRFAVSFHRQKRSKAFIHSELEQIEGVGDKTVQTLLRHFRTVEKVRAANIEELSALVGAAKAKKIRAFFEK